MGSCVNKSNEIITMRINEKQQNINEPSYTKNKKYMSTAVSSLDYKSNKFNKKKVNFSTLDSNDISKIIIIPEVRNYENNINSHNSIRELLDLFH